MEHYDRKFGLLVLFVSCLCFLVTLPVYRVSAQTSIPDEILTVSAPDRLPASPGSIVTFELSATIVDGWHINTNPATLDALIPTEVTVAGEGQPFSVNNVDYPAGKSYNFGFTDQPISVYEDRVKFPVRLSVGGNAMSTLHEVPLELTYQACDDRRCLPPKTKTISVKIDVRSGGGSEDKNAWPTIYSGATGQADRGRIAGTFRNQGVILGLLLVFLLGLSLNLTPCVYPMIPITVGYFGGRDREGFSRQFLDALFFVLGMAIIYTILGSLAALGGSMLGDSLQNPWVQLGMAGLMVVLSGTMFGLYELRLPDPIRQQSEEWGKALGTFGMGMTLGLVAAPCLAPSTVALLGFVGQLGSVWAGAGLFFVLSLGLGLPYVFLALFSSYLDKLPGSGEWMEWVKKVLGFIILGVALYFVWPMMSNAQFAYALIALTLLAAVVLTLIHPPESMAPYVIRGAVVVASAAAVVAVVGWTFLWVPEPINWEHPTGRLLENGTVSEPTVVYVGASWCVPCKEMEVTTFRDNRVRSALKDRVRAVKIDLSSTPGATVQAWLEQKNVLGVPTILYLSASDGEVEALRQTGYISADEFMENINQFTE